MSPLKRIVDRVVQANGFAVTRDERQRFVEEMVHEITGFGPLEPLLADPTITKVMVNGPRHVYIERGGKIQRVDAHFLNESSPFTRSRTRTRGCSGSWPRESRSCFRNE